MGEEDEKEMSDLDIGLQTWDKLEKNMKSLGFREGAAKGREISLQQGFDLGYSDGFKLGEHLGMLKGILSCQKELGIANTGSLSDEGDFQISSRNACTLCSNNNTQKVALSEEVYSKGLQKIISKQQDHNNQIIKALKLSNEKG